MDNREAVNWLINISADIGKVEHSDLWHYERALTEIKDMLESAQLSQEGTTSDTISRQWLLECVDEGWIRFDTEKDANRFIHLVRDIAPTAQSVATDTNVGDTISRQAVIDVIEDYPHGVWNVENMEDMVDKIKALTSVQPEECTEKRTEMHVCDLISRQQAIDLFPNDDLEWDTISGYIAPHVARRMIAHLPTIPPETPCYLYLGSPCEYQNPNVVISQPEPHWIPVSERMPEDLSEVNVTWVNHNPEPYYEFAKDKPFTATAVYYKSEWYWYSTTCVDYLAEYGRCDWNKIDKAIEIIAWMPLPEAYTK